MNNHDIESLAADFGATKTIGNGKHAQVVPDMRRRLRALDRFLKLRWGTPPQLVLGPDGKLYASRAWTGPFGQLPYPVLPSEQEPRTA